MSTTEAPWNAETPRPKSSNRKLWWIFGCAGAALFCVGIVATVFAPRWLRHHPIALHAQIDRDLSSVDAALEEYKARHGSYPRALNDLVAGGERLSSTGLPLDPWDRDYIMLAADEAHPRPRLLTYGRDGKLGGEGPDQDLEYSPR